MIAIMASAIPTVEVRVRSPETAGPTTSTRRKSYLSCNSPRISVIADCSHSLRLPAPECGSARLAETKALRLHFTKIQLAEAVANVCEIGFTTFRTNFDDRSAPGSRYRG